MAATLYNDESRIQLIVQLIFSLGTEQQDARVVIPTGAVVWCGRADPRIFPAPHRTVHARGDRGRSRHLAGNDALDSPAGRGRGTRNSAGNRDGMLRLADS